MPDTVSDFQDDTAFERLILDRAAPLIPTSEAGSVIDLRQPGGTSVNITLTDSTGSGGSNQLKESDVRPLLFGSAWKVLDLLVELALHLANIPPKDGKRYTIKEKRQQAAAGSVTAIPPFGSHPDLWLRLMGIYSSTEALRHSLVHRRLKVDPATGLMEGQPNPGEPTPKPLTAVEQLAFCRAAKGTAEAVIAGALSTRQSDQLGSLLDQLTQHHGKPALGATGVQGVIPTILASAEVSEEVTVQMDQIIGRAKQAVGGLAHFDLQLHLPDGRILAGALEDAPTGVITFPLDQPPSWLHWT